MLLAKNVSFHQGPRAGMVVHQKKEESIFISYEQGGGEKGGAHAPLDTRSRQRSVSKRKGSQRLARGRPCEY